MITDNITKWNSIQSNERWGFNDSSSIFIRKKDSFNLFRMVEGKDSLAKLVQSMANFLLKDSYKKLENPKDIHLKTLKEKIDHRVTHYKRSHSSIYLQFMKIIGRDIDASYKNFGNAYQATINSDKQIRAFEEAQKNRLEKQNQLEKEKKQKEAIKQTKIQELTTPYEPSCAINGLYIPLDQTSQLSSLLQCEFYVKAEDEHKLRLLSSFIHLLPLNNFFKGSSEDILDALKKVSYKRGGYLPFDERHNFVKLAAIQLVQKKTNFVWLKDWKEIISLFYKTGMGNYVYHGTNLIALENIQKNGLGSPTRDYDLKELATYYNVRQTSAGRTDTFYVAGNPTTSFIYGNDSPEWLLFLEEKLNEKKGENLQQKETLQNYIQKYRSPDNFAIIQIKLQKNLYTPEAFLEELEKLNSPLSYETTSFMDSILFYMDDNQSLKSLQSSSVVYYSLPKMKSIKR